MEGDPVDRSPGDLAFRRRVLSALEGARSSVRVIAGELASYDFPELRDAAHALASRNVDVRAYANEPSSTTATSLQQAGIRLSIGRLRSFHHYLMVDRSLVVTSLKDRSGVPTATGTRRAVVSPDDPDLAEAVEGYGEFLESAAHRRFGEERARDLRWMLAELDRCRPMVRRIPLGENLLMIGGLDEEVGRRFVAEAREQVRQALTLDGRPPGLMTETTLLNEMCLRTAALLC